MTVLAWPSDVLEPSSFKPRLLANTQSGGRSPFDGTEQTLVLPGARWACEARWEGLQQEEWRVLAAFLWSLVGRGGRFSWAFPIPRRGTQTGGLVAGANQAGRTLATDGWSGSGYAVRTGDWIGWTDATGRPALHHVTADATPVADACSIAITPMIRRPPPDNAALVLVAPSCVWMLATDDLPEPDIRPGLMADLSIQVVEALW
jgi:hypothetical protein